VYSVKTLTVTGCTVYVYMISVRAIQEELNMAAKGKKTAPKTKAETVNETVQALSWDKIIEDFRAKVSKATAPADATVATQIKLYGSVEGILYVLIANGIVVVEPFDYKGADLEIEADSDVFVGVINGTRSISNAIADGDIKMQGNAGKAMILGAAVFFN
jgi:putative sterol carrier protein